MRDWSLVWYYDFPSLKSIGQKMNSKLASGGNDWEAKKEGLVRPGSVMEELLLSLKG